MIHLTITETVTREFYLEETPEHQALIADLRERMWAASRIPQRVLGIKVGPRASMPQALVDVPQDLFVEMTSYHVDSPAGFEIGEHGAVTRR